MSELPPDCWVPVPLRWRHVVAGDTFVGRENQLWHVEEINGYGAALDVAVRCSGDTHRVDVDPDEAMQVLVPVAERDAVELLREELGARLAAQRTV